MRYRINFSIRQLLRKHYVKLSKTSIQSNLQNLLYKNISISKEQIEILLSKSKIPSRLLNLKEVNFYPEKNFGVNYKPIKIKFNGRNPDFAEFIGEMLGDGNIYRNTVRITINSQEQDFKKHIMKLFEKLFGVKPKIYLSKKTKAIQIYVYSKKLRILLEKHGLGQGNKVTRNIKVPKWIKNNKTFSKYCIRGMIDTDGCVFYHKRDKQLYISFHNYASNLLMDLQKMAKHFNLKFVRNNIYTVTLYKKLDVNNYIREIGFSNEKHISKVNKYLGL